MMVSRKSWSRYLIKNYVNYFLSLITIEASCWDKNHLILARTFILENRTSTLFPLLLLKQDSSVVLLLYTFFIQMMKISFIFSIWRYSVWVFVYVSRVCVCVCLSVCLSGCLYVCCLCGCLYVCCLCGC